MSSSSDAPISTAVVTGGHFYEVVDFHRLFRSLDGVDAYIQHLDDFVESPPAMRDAYEVVLFFTMLLEGPQGEHLEALERINAARQGVVVLHHSILAFPYSPFWRRWTDLHNLSHSVDPPEPITTEIADPHHPITSGLADWEMVDEIYRMGGPGAGSHVLLAARHPHSMRAGVGPRDRRPAGDVLPGGSRSSGLDQPQLPHRARTFDPLVRPPHMRPVERPNILLILADDLGYGDVACYNPESKVPTPHIDRLAAEGMSFTDAHSPATVCTPSRYSILTGRMEFRTGVPGVFTGAGGPCLIEESRLTLPGVLRDLGYATALFGKWHVGLSFLDRNGRPINENGFEPVERIDYTRAIPDAPIHRGFDHFYGTACCPTTDFLYAFIDGDRIPVPPTRLHDRAGFPDHPYARDNRIGWLAPGFDFAEMDMVFLERSVQFLERHAAESPDRPFFLLHSTQGVHLPSLPGKAFQGRTGAGPHGDFIFEFDYVVGELLATLDRLGLAENTLVMVTSDNGPEVTSVVNMRRDHDHDGARPWRGMKRDQWEGGHRVPFVVRWPRRISAGSSSDQTVCLCDLMATCAAITGVDLPDTVAEDSYDILPAMLGETPAGEAVRAHTLHQSFLSNTGSGDGPSLYLSIRRGKWKYLDHRGSGGNDYTREELRPYVLPEKAPDAPGQLYDLEADPGETTNLYFEQPRVVAELKTVLDRFVDSGRSAPLRRA